MSLCAGLASGLVSCVLLQPLDLIKTKLQVQETATRYWTMKRHTMKFMSITLVFLPFACLSACLPACLPACDGGGSYLRVFKGTLSSGGLPGLWTGLSPVSSWVFLCAVLCTVSLCAVLCTVSLALFRSLALTLLLTVTV